MRDCALTAHGSWFRTVKRPPAAVWGEGVGRGAGDALARQEAQSVQEMTTGSHEIFLGGKIPMGGTLEETQMQLTLFVKAFRVEPAKLSLLKS